jgi:hypothetical protein
MKEFVRFVQTKHHLMKHITPTMGQFAAMGAKHFFEELTRKVESQLINANEVNN